MSEVIVSMWGVGLKRRRRKGKAKTHDNTQSTTPGTKCLVLLVMKCITVVVVVVPCWL